MSSDLARQTRDIQAQQTAEPIQTMFERQADGLAMALSGRIGVDRFIRAAVTAFRTTPALQNCSRESVLGGLFVAAQLGLEVGGPRGYAYLVPYGREASLIIGYRGWIKLWRNTGLVAKVETVDVREGDSFRMGSDSRTGGRWYEHVAQDQDASRPLLGVVAQIVLKDGTVQWDYLTEEQILTRRPKRWTGTPWQSWPDEMYRKTVLRHLSKLADASTDDETLALAAAADETVQRRVEVPGLEPEIRGEHLAVAARPDAPTPPATPGQRPGPPAPPRPRQEPQDAPSEREPAEPDPEPAEEDEDAWDAQEIAEHERFLAEQDEESGR